MNIIRLVLSVMMIMVSIIMTIIILMQEGKSEGLGVIAGTSNTYWSKNKGRSMKGFLEKFTAGLVICFFVLAVLLNIHLF